MSSVVKKCPRDCIVYDATFTGTCASCFGPLKFFCKTHNEWLEDANCPKCSGPATSETTPPMKAPSAGPSIVGMLAVLAICVGVFAVCGLFVYRAIYAKPKPVSGTAPTPAVSPPSVPPPVPVKVAAPAPPVSAPAVATLSLGQLLAEPDQYVGKLVKITGSIQFRDAGKETFDLRQGDHIITVHYRNVPAAMKTIIAGTSADRLLRVSGTLTLDATDNSYYLIARSADTP